jgi:hypothetical protein
MPAWVAGVFAGLAAALVPWTVFLAVTLPERHAARNWDDAWTGFDIGLALSFLATAYAALRRPGWLQRLATVSGTLLVCDAWFDVLTGSTGREFELALILALLVELPLAAFCFFVATKNSAWTAARNQPGANGRRRARRA